MKYKFEITNLETGIITQSKTLQEVSILLNIPYHQARSLLLSEEKQFLHPVIKDLKLKWNIIKL